MAKYRIVLEVETRQFTADELHAEGEDGMDAGLLDPPTAAWLGDQIANALACGAADEMIFAGSDMFHKINSARVVTAEVWE